jgi:hypothetical protein
VDRLAYVITDHPILAAAVRRSLQGKYTVVHLSWAESATQSRTDTGLVVLDITGLETHEVLPVLAAFRAPVRIAVSSLDRDQVDLYLLDDAGLSRLGALPSLVSLTA